MFYSIIGIALLLLSAGTIGWMVVLEVRDRNRNPIQSKKKAMEKTILPGIFGCNSQSLCILRNAPGDVDTVDRAVAKRKWEGKSSPGLSGS